MILKKEERTEMNEQQAAFEGWAILEIFGHQTFAGFVKTVYFGPAAMFQLEVPALEERTRVTTRAGSVDGKWTAAGATVKEAASPGYTKLFGVGALYSMTPCTQEAALKAVENLQPRSLMLVSLPIEKALAASAEPISRDYTCCEGNPEDGHEMGCPNEFDEDSDDD
jgi:hypothetical protein